MLRGKTQSNCLYGHGLIYLSSLVCFDICTEV